MVSFFRVLNFDLEASPRCAKDKLVLQDGDYAARNQIEQVIDIREGNVEVLGSARKLA